MTAIVIIIFAMLALGLNLSIIGFFLDDGFGGPGWTLQLYGKGIITLALIAGVTVSLIGYL